MNGPNVLLLHGKFVLFYASQHYEKPEKVSFPWNSRGNERKDLIIKGHIHSDDIA